MFPFRDYVMCGQTFQVVCVKIMSIAHKKADVKSKVRMQTMVFNKARVNI